MRRNLKIIISVMFIISVFMIFSNINVYANTTEYNVTAKEFGAKPNDATDDYEAINNALKKAKETNETVTVYIPAGEYIISKQLYIYSDTKLILDKNTVIKSTLSEDFTSMIVGQHDDEKNNHGGYSNIQNIEISGGTWNRNSSSNIITNAITLHHGNNINIHDLTIKNCTDHVIDISANKDVTIKNVVFQNHIAYTGEMNEYWGNHNKGDTERFKYVEAIYTDIARIGESIVEPVDNTACQNITIDNCKFEGVLAGIGAHNELNYKATKVSVTNCEFTNLQYGAAINAWSFDTLTVKNNTLTGSDIGVMSVKSTGSIADNSFVVTGKACDIGVIHAQDSALEIKNNTIENASKHAITIIGGEANITNNTIKKSASDGIAVNNTTKTTISDNTISGIARYAMFLKNCTGENTIKSNTINSTTAEVGIFVDESGNNNSIVANNISGKFTLDICVMSSSGIINNNTLDACTRNAIQLESSNFTVTSNIITSIGTSEEMNGNGIFISKGEVEVLKNTITKVNGNGIYAKETSKINISENKLKEVGRNGIGITDATGSVDVTDNEIKEGNAKYGIYIQECSGKNTIKRNVITCSSSTGILIYKCSGTIIENIVTNCEGNALYTLGNSDNFTTYDITDNILKNTSQKSYNIVLDSYSRNSKVNNNILGDAGIYAADGVTYTEIKFTGFRKDEKGVERYYKEGKQDDTTGLVQVSGTWYYLKNGVVDVDYTGLVHYNGNWFYVQKGILNWGIRTLVQYNGMWYYVNNSTLDWGYTGLVLYNGNWFYIQNGQLNWEIETLVQYNGKWYYVNNSTLDWNYTGLCQYNGSWFYVQNGQLNWGIETLVQYNGTWYYVNNSMLDWNYTGLCQYNGSWFYIQNGQLNWGIETLVQYYGTWYYVNNSTLDWNFTGLCEYNGTTYYIQNGTLYWGYNGNIVYNGKVYKIQNSMAIV